jgi:hypothetical protein
MQDWQEEILEREGFNLIKTEVILEKEAGKINTEKCTELFGSYTESCILATDMQLSKS